MPCAILTDAQNRYFHLEQIHVTQFTQNSELFSQEKPETALVKYTCSNAKETNNRNEELGSIVKSKLQLKQFLEIY